MGCPICFQSYYVPHGMSDDRYEVIGTPVHVLETMFIITASPGEDDGSGRGKLEVGNDQERPSLPQARPVPQPYIATSALVPYMDNCIVPHNTPTRLSHTYGPCLTYHSSVSQYVRMRA